MTDRTTQAAPQAEDALTAAQRMWNEQATRDADTIASLRAQVAKLEALEPVHEWSGRLMPDGRHPRDVLRASIEGVRPMLEKPAQPARVTQGWKMAPREPTTQMNQAGYVAYRATGLMSEIWRAMLAAAPAAPQPSQPMTACPHGVPHRWPCETCDQPAKGGAKPSVPAHLDPRWIASADAQPCRDCADFGPVCPNTGKPCGGDAA